MYVSHHIYLTYNGNIWLAVSRSLCEGLFSTDLCLFWRMWRVCNLRAVTLRRGRQTHVCCTDQNMFCIQSIERRAVVRSIWQMCLTNVLMCISHMSISYITCLSHISMSLCTRLQHEMCTTHCNTCAIGDLLVSKETSVYNDIMSHHVIETSKETEVKRDLCECQCQKRSVYRMTLCQKRRWSFDIRTR